MPFVSDIVGPQQPVQTWPPLDTVDVLAQLVGNASQPAAPDTRRLGRRVVGVRVRGAARGDHPRHRGENASRRNGTIPSVHGPVAPPLTPPGDDGLHAVEPLRPHGMRVRVHRRGLGGHVDADDHVGLRGEFVGTSTAIADLDALLDLRAGR
jgi:hypothetical protein